MSWLFLVWMMRLEMFSTLVPDVRKNCYFRMSSKKLRTKLKKRTLSREQCTQCTYILFHYRTMYVVLTVVYTVVLKERLKKNYTTDKKRSKNTCTAGKEFNYKI